MDQAPPNSFKFLFSRFGGVILAKTQMVVQAASFGGTNIDPTAWEDKKCPGESRFPAQVSQ